MKKIYFLIVIISYCISNAQQIPLKYNDNTNYSKIISAYGPRLKTSAGPYDYHDGFDYSLRYSDGTKVISNTSPSSEFANTKVVAVQNGFFLGQQNVGSQDDRFWVRHNDQNGNFSFKTMYMHIQNIVTKNFDESISPTEKLAELRIYPPTAPHLDFRASLNGANLTETSPDLTDWRSHAINPGRFVVPQSDWNAKFGPNPVVYETEYEGNVRKFVKEVTDDHIFKLYKNTNDTKGWFVSFGVGVGKQELDLNRVEVNLDYTLKNANGSTTPYDESSLLFGTNSYKNIVDYDLNINCGRSETTSNPFYYNSSIGIYPSPDYTTSFDDKYLVEYRFYLDENLLTQIKNALAIKEIVQNEYIDLEINLSEWLPSNLTTLDFTKPKTTTIHTKIQIRELLSISGNYTKIAGNNVITFKPPKNTRWNAYTLNPKIIDAATGQEANPSKYSIISNTIDGVKILFNTVTGPAKYFVYIELLRKLNLQKTSDGMEVWSDNAIVSNPIEVNVFPENAPFTSARFPEKVIYNLKSGEQAREYRFKFSFLNGMNSFPLVKHTTFGTGEPPSWLNWSAEIENDELVVRIPNGDPSGRTWSIDIDDGTSFPDITKTQTIRITQLYETNPDDFNITSPNSSGTDVIYPEYGTYPIVFENRNLTSNVTYTATDVNGLDLYFSPDGGINWLFLENKQIIKQQLLHKGTNNNSYDQYTMNVTFPEAPAIGGFSTLTNCYFKIIDNYNDIYMQSGKFKIVDPLEPTLSLSAPSANSTYKYGNSLQIIWTCSNLSTVTLWYNKDSTDPNSSWVQIIDPATGSGTFNAGTSGSQFNWTVPSTPILDPLKRYDNFQIEVRGNSAIYQNVKATQKITVMDFNPWIEVIRPEKNKIYQSGPDNLIYFTVSWRVFNMTGNKFSFYLSIDNEVSWIPLKENTSESIGSGDSYYLNLHVSGYNSDNCIIKISHIKSDGTIDGGGKSEKFILYNKGTISTFYVSKNGSSNFPYGSELTAADNIDVILPYVSDGDKIIVKEGTYKLAKTLTIEAAITIESEKGPYLTTIDGDKKAFPVVSIKNSGCKVEGFTIRNGGGIVFNSAGLVNRCIIKDNNPGGVVFKDNGRLMNSLVINNFNYNLGGVYFENGGTAINCTITRNRNNMSSGGGIHIKTQGTIKNCIIYHNYFGTNTDDGLHNYEMDPNAVADITNTCTTPQISGNGNIASDPLLTVDDILSLGSPCLNVGNNDFNNLETDLIGQPRKKENIIDIGAFEGTYENHQVKLNPILKESPSFSPHYIQLKDDNTTQDLGTDLTFNIPNPLPIYEKVIKFSDVSNNKFVGWTDGIKSNYKMTPNETEFKRLFTYESGNNELLAIYKIPHVTDNSSAFSNPNQRKIVKTPAGTLHMVYESMDRIWYETSSDAGVTWELANEGKPLPSEGATKAFEPSIIYSRGSNIYVSYITETPDGSNKIKLCLIDANGTNSVIKDIFVQPFTAKFKNLVQSCLFNGSNDNIFMAWEVENSIPVFALVEFNGTNLNVIDYPNPPTTDKIYFEISIDSGLNEFYLVWQQGNNDIKLQKYSINGDPAGTPIQISAQSSYGNNSPVVSSRILDNGTKQPIVCWKGNNQAVVSAMKPDGTWEPPVYLGTGVTSVNMSAITNSDDAVISWLANNETSVKYVTRKNGNFSPVKTLTGITSNIQFMQGAESLDNLLAFYVDAATPPYAIKSTPLLITSPVALNLQSGWNWISLPLIPANNTLNSIFGTTGYSETDDIIKDQLSYAQFLQGTGWVGSLSAMDYRSMYMVKLASEKAITLTGETIDPSSNPITLNSGWTWIGYFVDFPSTITNTKDDIPNLKSIAAAGDRIISQDGSFSLFEKTETHTYWNGTLTTLNPSKGYKYFSTSAASKSFSWPSSQSLNKKTETVNYASVLSDFKINPAKYEYGMYLIVDLPKIDGISNDDGTLTAYINGECRGAVNPIYVESQNKNLYFLAVFSNKSSGEEITFKINFKNRIVDIANKILYQSNKFIGELASPLNLNFDNLGKNGIPTEYSLAQNFPNPFNPTTTINFSIPQSGNVRLIIYNSLGQEVRTLYSGVKELGNYSVVWDGKDGNGRNVSSGLYLYRVTAGNYSQTRKMILLK